jgi:hypothetical protein
MDLYLGIAVVIATILGPIVAVFVTRMIDDGRSRKQRQTDVFRSLMRSRRWALSPDYVNALNLVEVEFAGIKPVENAQRELFQHLNQHTQSQEWGDKWRRLQTRLLYAIAVHLGYKMEQLDVLEGGYIPSDWGSLEDQQRALLHSMNELLSGKRLLPVQLVDQTPPANNIRPLNPPGQ